MFRQKWPLPLAAVDTERIRKLIGDLDSKDFAEREAAEAESIKQAQKASHAVRAAAKITTSQEVRIRANKRFLKVCNPKRGGRRRRLWSCVPYGR